MILAKSKIADFERFWGVFSSAGAEHRANFGSKGARVLRDQDDPTEVWILFEWDKDGFQRFLADDKAKEIMASAGLQGPPEAIFVEVAGETES